MHYYKLDFKVRRTSYKVMRTTYRDAVFSTVFIVATAVTILLQIRYYIPL
jgi:energy-coupling factor transport system permease protein